MTSVYWWVDSGRMDNKTRTGLGVDASGGIVWQGPFAPPTFAAPAPKNAAPKVGDRVKVTIEGEVTAAAGGVQDTFRVCGIWVYPSDDEVTVEVVDAPWLPGDVAGCEHGGAFLRSAKHTWITSSGSKVGQACDLPLTLLVRGGKAV